MYTKRCSPDSDVIGDIFNYRERKCADTILAQCRFPGLAISNAKILVYFQMKYTYKTAIAL